MRTTFAAWTLAACATALGGCASTSASDPRLASARSAPDFDSYHLTRVGLLPFRGAQVGASQSATLQEAFLFELSHTAPFEVVALSAADIAEIERVITPASVAGTRYDEHQMRSLDSER